MRMLEIIERAAIIPNQVTIKHAKGIFRTHGNRLAWAHLVRNNLVGRGGWG